MDDFNQPDETKISYSKSYAVLEFCGGMAVLLIAAISYFYNHRPVVAGIVTVAGLYFIFLGIRKYFNRKPQLTISTKGISTIKTAFKSWPEIKDEKVYNRFRGYKGVYLTYAYENGREDFRINTLDITSEDMASLLISYRQRSKIYNSRIYKDYDAHHEPTEENPDPLFEINPTYKKYLITKK